MTWKEIDNVRPSAALCQMTKRIWCISLFVLLYVYEDWENKPSKW